MLMNDVRNPLSSVRGFGIASCWPPTVIIVSLLLAVAILAPVTEPHAGVQDNVESRLASDAAEEIILGFQPVIVDRRHIERRNASVRALVAGGHSILHSSERFSLVIGHQSIADETVHQRLGPVFPRDQIGVDRLYRFSSQQHEARSGEVHRERLVGTLIELDELAVFPGRQRLVGKLHRISGHRNVRNQIPKLGHIFRSELYVSVEPHHVCVVGLKELCRHFHSGAMNKALVPTDRPIMLYSCRVQLIFESQRRSPVLSSDSAPITWRTEQNAAHRAASTNGLIIVYSTFSPLAFGCV